MESSEQPEIVPAPSQFATADPSQAVELKSRIVACVRESFPNPQAIHVTVFGGTVVLRGVLSSSQDKLRCLVNCRRVPGVIKVVDELVVADEKPVDFDLDEK
jgi:hypothetical protein